MQGRYTDLPRPAMAYVVSGGALNPTHSLTLTSVGTFLDTMQGNQAALS